MNIKKQDNTFLKASTKSMRKLSMDVKADPKTIRNAVHIDLHLESCMRTSRHLLTHAIKVKRHERTKKVLWYLKHNRQTTIKIFLDENIFTVDAVLKCCSDWYIAKSSFEVKCTFRTKHPSVEERCELTFIIKSYGISLPWLESNFPNGNYV